MLARGTIRRMFALRWLAICVAAAWFRLMLRVGEAQELVGVAQLSARVDPDSRVLVDNIIETIMMAHKDIQNGGLLQFYANGIVPRLQYQDALSRAGLADVSTILGDANALFPKDAPRVRWTPELTEMRSWLEGLGISRERLAPFDDAYSVATEDIEERLAAHIRSHSSEYDPWHYPGYVDAFFRPVSDFFPPGTDLATVNILASLIGEPAEIDVSVGPDKTATYVGVVSSLKTLEGKVTLSLRAPRAPDMSEPQAGTEATKMDILLRDIKSIDPVGPG